MKPNVQEKPITAEQLARMPNLGPCELVDGRIVPLSPAGSRHNTIVGRINRLLSRHVDKHDLGLVTSGEGGYLVRRDPDRVRAPDLAFVSHETIAHAEAEDSTYYPHAPDLAIEVLSPDDAWQDVEERMRDYLGAGGKAVWVVNPAAESVHVYGRSARGKILGRGDTIDGGDALPGFKAKVAEFFGEAQKAPKRRGRRGR